MIVSTAAFPGGEVERLIGQRPTLRARRPNRLALDDLSIFDAVEFRRHRAGDVDMSRYGRHR